MQLINHRFVSKPSHWILLILCLYGLPLLALETDRQQTLEVFAENTDGSLGDGITTLHGNVDIRQGTLHITADKAILNKGEGRVKSVTFHGQPAFLEQEIEEQGLVQATAMTIDYQVASGLVTLTGNAEVRHPQYQISGDVLTYDLNTQHFEGSSGKNGDGRIRIRLDPELIEDKSEEDGEKEGTKESN